MIQYNPYLVAGDSENSSDEMEKLYIHLKEASLSPIGDRKPSTRREFRASFVKRCKNQNVNDKLHLIRTLNSTLKVHTSYFTPFTVQLVCELCRFFENICIIIYIFPIFFTLFWHSQKRQTYRRSSRCCRTPDLLHTSSERGRTPTLL